ncbi:alpha/beta hydrolase [Glycomyces halotolerans]
MAHALCNGIEIGYDEAGDGPAVILIHGALADRRMWDDQFEDLAADHRVIRYDGRGHGESGSGEGAYSHHRDLLALMEALEVDQAVLVGNSMGGGHALDAALAAPGRVSGLVLVSSGIVGHEWPSSFVQQARERVHSTVPPERLAEYRKGNGTTVPELERDLDAFAEAHIRWMVAGPARTEHDLPASAWERAVSMFRDQLRRTWTEPPRHERVPEMPAERLLGRIRVPALVVNGLEDVPEIQAVSDLLSGKDTGIPDARRVDLPDTGHAAPLERPAEFTALLREFLA